MTDAAAITVALLTPSDVEEYRRVRLRALVEHPASFRSDAEEEAAKPLRWWEERLAPRTVSGAAFVGAWTAAHRLIGSAGLLFESRRKVCHTATLIGMYVMPEHAGRGIGARLVEACVELGRADSAVEILYLTVTSTNSAAIRLYERTGFVAYGLEPRSMRLGDRTFDKLMMALHLRPA